MSLLDKLSIYVVMNYERENTYDISIVMRGIQTDSQTSQSNCRTQNNDAGICRMTHAHCTGSSRCTRFGMFCYA